ncbi:hypothetical protein K2W90_00940 [Candidatus Babeliales bacterium]|nr:hypothetical protein [Candidatus Babeliales bacterium]
MKKFITIVLLCCVLSVSLRANTQADLEAAYTQLESLKQAQAPAQEIERAQKAFDALTNQAGSEALQACPFSKEMSIDELKDRFLKLTQFVSYDSLSYDDQRVMDALLSRTRQIFESFGRAEYQKFAVTWYVEAMLNAQEQALFMLEFLRVGRSVCPAAVVEVPLDAHEHAHVALAIFSQLVEWAFDNIKRCNDDFETKIMRHPNVLALVCANVPQRFQPVWWLFDRSVGDLFKRVSSFWLVRIECIPALQFHECCRDFLLQPKKTEEMVYKLETEIYRAYTMYDKQLLTKQLFEIFVCRLNMVKKEQSLTANFASSDQKIDVLIKHKALVEDDVYATLFHDAKLRKVVGQYYKVVEGVLYDNLGTVQLTYEIYALTKKLVRLQSKQGFVSKYFLGCCSKASFEADLINDMLAVVQDAALLVQKNAKNTVLSGQLFEQANGLLDHPMIKKTLDRYVGIPVENIKKTALNVVGAVSPLVALGILKLVAPQAEQEIKKEAATVTVEGPHIASYLEKHPEVFEKLIAQHPELVGRLADQVAAKLPRS